MNNYQTQEPSELEELLIRTAGDLAQSLSINRVAGQLYALLYISPEPVSLEDMSAKLRISKGSASVNIRILEEWNAVKCVWVAGTRKDFYTAEPDFLKILIERLEKGVARRLAEADGNLARIEEKLEALEKSSGAKQKQAAFYRERIKKLIELKGAVEKALEWLPKLKAMKSLGVLKGLMS